MNMTAVISSDIAGVGYEIGILHIRFNAGGTYWYSGVPQPVSNGLIRAPSHGNSFPAYINGVYSSRQV